MRAADYMLTIPLNLQFKSANADGKTAEVKKKHPYPD